MNRYIISSGSTADDLLPVGMALHEMLNRLPITARSKEQPGIRIESGVVVDNALQRSGARTGSAGEQGL